jgi:hypothetical protein
MDTQFAGMVEAWAAGVTWKELMADCGMDEGDVARLLRRSIDLLAQVMPLVLTSVHLLDFQCPVFQGGSLEEISDYNSGSKCSPDSRNRLRASPHPLPYQINKSSLIHPLFAFVDIDMVHSPTGCRIHIRIWEFFIHVVLQKDMILSSSMKASYTILGE